MKRIVPCVMLLFLVACSDKKHGAPPPAPIHMECCSGTLTWEPNTESDLAGYRIYRSETPNIQDPKAVTLLDEVTLANSTPTFTDTTGIEGTIYYYVVTAFDTAGNESDVSNEVDKLY